jgi:hypothetical protein
MTFAIFLTYLLDDILIGTYLCETENEAILETARLNKELSKHLKSDRYIVLVQQ